MTEEIKPCPFCGCETVTIREGSTFRWAQAECDNCGATSGEVRVNTLQIRNDADVRKSALEEWNMRANEKLTSGALAAPKPE